MIPFAAVACMIELHDGTMLECSLQDLSAISFTVRLPSAWMNHGTDDIATIALCFHDNQGDASCRLQQEDWTCEVCQDPDYTWRFETMHSTFRRLANQFMQRYQQYVALKSAGDDANLSHVLTGYPADAETMFASDLASQRRAMLADLQPDARWQQVADAIPGLAVALSEPCLWQQYLSMPMRQFSDWYWQKKGLAHHPVAARPFNCVMIGNMFCPNLTPSYDLYISMISKACSEQVTPVIVLPPVPESRFDGMTLLLDRLSTWCGEHACRLEIVLNDWGLLGLAHQRWGDSFAITLGTMLQKRRKDGRMPYMQGFGGKAINLAENAANAGFYTRFLHDLGVQRMSMEACGYEQTPTDGLTSLHLPFYQMNTAGHCTLYAVCHHGDRGHQQQVLHCSYECENITFLYPERLLIMSRFNTLFGFDARSLADGEYLASMTKKAVDRLVFDLL